MVNIGREIGIVMSQRGMNHIEFARLLGFKTNNRMKRIFKSEGINTELLIRICKALKYNFFKLYMEEMKKELPVEQQVIGNQSSVEKEHPAVAAVAAAEKEVLELRKENADLKEKISYLKTIHELVMKKKQ